MCTAPEPPLQAGEAVLTLRDMTSDAQTPLAHATMLCDTSGFQWHVSLKPVTCQWMPLVHAKNLSSGTGHG